MLNEKPAPSGQPGWQADSNALHVQANANQLESDQGKIKMRKKPSLVPATNRRYEKGKSSLLIGNAQMVQEDDPPKASKNFDFPLKAPQNKRSSLSSFT